ncbi:MAG: hypothetical protein J6K52_01820 [Clostridia bacterium]|nr:hypothetical protein [Clostridia bacterium]
MAFKESVKKGYGTVKEKAKQAWGKTKSFYKDTKSDWQKAYEVGYKQGWKDSQLIPNRFGSRTAAVLGYGKGIRNERRSREYSSKAKN